MGLSSVKDSTAFKKIQYHSKSPAHYLFTSQYFSDSRSANINPLYSNTSTLINAKDYYTSRQNSFTSLLANDVNTHTNLDKAATEKYLAYNFGIRDAQLGNSNVQFDLRHTFLNKDIIDSTTSNSVNNLSLGKFDSEAFDKSTVNNTSDGKYHNNPVRPLLTSPQSRKSAVQPNLHSYTDLLTYYPLDEVSSSKSNASSHLLSKELKSPNLGFLSADKNSRLINKLHSSKGQLNLSPSNVNLTDAILSSKGAVSSVNESNVYDNSNLFWNSLPVVSKLSALNNATTNAGSPIYSNDPTWVDKSFTKFETEGQSPRTLRSKEETAPSHLFSEYWSTH